jgi:hypothetical protein
MKWLILNNDVGYQADCCEPDLQTKNVTHVVSYFSLHT